MYKRKFFTLTLHGSNATAASLIIAVLLALVGITHITAAAFQELGPTALVMEALNNDLSRRAQQAPCELTKKRFLSGPLSGDEARSCQINLAAGQYVDIVIEARDIDIVIVAVGPSGTHLAEVDTRDIPEVSAKLRLVTNQSGIYRLDIKAPKNGRGPGSYEIRFVELREANQVDRELQRARDLETESIRLKDKGEFSAAVKPSEEAKSIREKLLGPESIELAASFLLLGELAQVKGEFDKAVEYYQRVVTITEKIRSKDDLGVALALGRMGTTYYEAREFNKAKTALDRARDIWEKSRDASHPLFVETLDSLAGVYEEKGDYASAEPLYLRGLAIRESRLAADNPAIAASLNNLALLHYKKGEYSKAQAMYVRAIDISKSRSQDDPDMAFLFNNLAMVHRVRGEYSKAVPLYQRVLKIREKEPGPQHPFYAATLNNLALVHTMTGDYQKAEENYGKALEIFEKAPGKNSSELAATLNNLAVLYHLKGEYAKAEPLLQKVISIKEAIGGSDHPDIAISLNTLALLYEATADYEKAEPLLTRAMTIIEKKFRPDHPEVALTANSIGVVQFSRGDYSAAESSFQKALAIWKNALGEHHPNVALSLSNLSLLYEARGEIKRAIESRTLANEITESNINLNLGAGSDRQKLLYLTSLRNQTDETLSLQVNSASSEPTACRLALTTVLRRKGRALDAMGTSIALLRQRLTPENRELLDQLTDLRARISALVFSGPVRQTPEQYQAHFKKLEDTADDLETQISRKSEEFRVQSQPTTLESVQSAIPHGASLVEFALYRSRKAKVAAGKERISAPRYVVYVLPNRGEPQWADLGDAAKIDTAINNFRHALREPARRDVRQRARDLDELVMNPVRKLLGPTRTVLLSPDGLLNLVPFSALVDERGEFLIKNYSFTYLSSGRDLMRLGISLPSREGPTIVANPDFGPLLNRSNSSGAISRGAFKPLPGTSEQARELKKLMPDALVFVGEQATESTIKKAKGPVILHVATHGFFLTETDGKGQADPPLAFNLAGSQLGNALLRSGVALAGANINREGPDDGVLTALEAASLDLSGTKLVVLSACDTGIGEVKSGEGVYGLRRALVLAGSESQVISLWQVSDAATRDLMIYYYRALANAEGRSEALREAQLKILARPDRWHPYYWAGFIESGSWASMPLGTVGKPSNKK